MVFSKVVLPEPEPPRMMHTTRHAGADSFTDRRELVEEGRSKSWLVKEQGRERGQHCCLIYVILLSLLLPQEQSEGNKKEF